MLRLDNIESVLLSRRIGADSLVKCVAIVGGTHGNERHGVHMVHERVCSEELSDPLSHSMSAAGMTTSMITLNGLV